LTLPSGFSLELSNAGPGYPCPVRNGAGPRATSVTGSVTVVDYTNGGGFPAHVSADLTLAFPPNDAGAPTSESIVGQDIDVTPGCP
jgi:hypothetical protein